MIKKGWLVAVASAAVGLCLGWVGALITGAINAIDVAGMAQIGVGIITAVLTAVYVVLTHSLVLESRAARGAQVTVDIVERHGAFYFEVRNPSAVAVTNLEIWVDPPIHTQLQRPFTLDHVRLRTFGPGALTQYFIAVTGRWYDEGQPLQFDVKIEYDDPVLGRVPQKYQFDLEAVRRSQLNTPTVEDSLKEIAAALNKKKKPDQSL